MVAGSGKGRYYVHDVSGKILIGEQTNAAVELLPGNYIVELNGTTQRITVSEGQNATVAAGGAMVAGSGKARYYVHDVSGKILVGEQTNAAVELLPGNYTVELNGTTQRITVSEGQNATVAAGGAMVAGSGTGRYYVHDVSGKILVGEQTNAAVELLPGNYIVELNGTTQSITVSEGQNATVAAGGATVAGSGTGRYYVHDVAGKILIGGQTNAAVELLPGNYTVELNGTTQRFPIRAGEQTIVRMK